MNEIKVKDMMTHLVVMAHENDPIQQIAGRLVRNGISGAPVVRDGKVVGVVSEMDIVRALASPANVDHGLETADVLSLIFRATPASHKHVRTVSDVMSSPAITIGPEHSLFAAAKLMERHGVKRLPVVDDEGYLLGIMSRGDVVRAMTREDRDIRQDVVDAISILGPENFGDLDVLVKDGVVTLTGSCDRRSTRDIAVDIASRVAGVSEVGDRLDYDIDDASIRQVTNQVGRNDLRRDPWAVGPLVKEG